MFPRIAVLVHERDKAFSSTNYFIKRFMAEWIRMGAHVEVLHGAEKFVPADILIPHLDLTRTPPEYAAFFERYPVVVNRRLTDISKRRISRQLLTRDEPYDGPVIVKTNYNSCGHGERVVSPVRDRIKRVVPKRLRKPLKNRIPWRLRRSLDGYPIFDNPSAVPAGVWSNPHLVVEKFLPEMDGEHFVLRTWVFMGDQESSHKAWSVSPVVKAANVVGKELVPVPDELREMRRALGADFAKFDYVLHDGRVVLYDVNKTPTLSGTAPSDRQLEVVRRLATGLLAVRQDGV